MANGKGQLATDMMTFMENWTKMAAQAQELRARFGAIAYGDVQALATDKDLLPGTPYTRLQWNQMDQLLQDFLAFGNNGAISQGFRLNSAYLLADVTTS